MNDIVERLRDAQLNHNDFRFGWLAEASDEIERLRARNRRLEEALRFYADEETWAQRYDHVPYGSTTAAMPAGTWADDDGGEKARAALEDK